MRLFRYTSLRFFARGAFLLLPLLAASCQWMTEDYDEMTTDDSSAALYINITVSVSAGNPVTRVNPDGGEYGDGTEQGIDERENKINDITLIFYNNDADGINTSSDEAKVVCVKRYGVSRIDNTGTHTHKPTEPTSNYYEKEILYSTGNQKLEETQLAIGQSYKVLAVANTLVNAKVGDKIKDIRDQVLSTVYNGTGIATDATDFVMSSETDATVTLANPTDEVSDGQNKKVYYLDCIHIERLAARIDFWAKTKDPDQTTPTSIAVSYDATTYDHAGYVYKVGQKDADDQQDHFVLTSITPFNVMNGNEYMFKRTNDSSKPYLADETTNNWVLDCYSASPTGKNSTTAHPEYLASTLSSVRTDMFNDFNIVLSTRQTPSTSDAEGTKFSITDGVTADNIIIGYPKENTLRGSVTPLYYYATGLAFEGYYYKKNAATDGSGKVTGGTRKVFYHYLRHQGEQAVAYQALTDETLNTATLCPVSPAMNIGIVRNNIYRVSIESITPDEDDLYVQLLIKVKKWDKFVHTPIIM